MSVDHHLYVGPFVICRNEPAVSSFVIRTCSKKFCWWHGKHVATNYCADCGAEVITPLTKVRGF